MNNEKLQYDQCGRLSKQDELMMQKPVNEMMCGDSSMYEIPKQVGFLRVLLDESLYWVGTNDIHVFLFCMTVAAPFFNTNEGFFNPREYEED